LSLVNPRERWMRLAMAGVAGLAIAGSFALLFPQCLARPEGVSDELYRTWLANVREARPIYRHPLDIAFPIAVLPVIGLIGAIVATRRAWVQQSETVVGWVAVALFTAFAGAMLLWQVRSGPAAQMLSVPGATALAWIVVPWFLNRGSMLLRVFGSVAAFLIVSGLFAGFVVKYLPKEKKKAGPDLVGQANAACTRMTTLSALNKIPAATMFTHVDLGPRLITITHHNGIAGPYHRNEREILDVHRAFTGPPEKFRAIAAAHRAEYLLVCPNLAETTVYRSRSKNGFYGQLHKGRIPFWLERVPLPQGSPLRLWRIRYDLPDRAVSAPTPRPPRPGSP
jgi:hypothetical protein